MTKRIAIIGGGIAGVTATWQLAHLAGAGAYVNAQLFESSDRLGGIVETVHNHGFTIECGPDAWVTEKPWARHLVEELGLGHDLLPSNDATRKTHILLDGRLDTMPDGMRMMVPANLESLDRSSLFSTSAKQSYRAELARAKELKASAPLQDESVASFTRRHFGEEVLTRIAAPLLSGVLGGDVEHLSVQAVMPRFVAMEREHGSLIAALQAQPSPGSASIFTTLRSGLGILVDRLVAAVPPCWLHLNAEVTSISRSARQWRIHTAKGREDQVFDAVFLATPPHISRKLLRPLDPEAAELLHMEASSAVVVAMGYLDAPGIQLPPGFGFLVPPSPDRHLLACTFVDQKFNGRVPPGGRLLRAFFGAQAAETLLDAPDNDLSALAQAELTRILGPLPQPDINLVRRWPHSLPQYAVGHLTRMAALDRCVAALPGLTLLGNGYRGVGLPDLIRDSRAAAHKVLQA